MVLPYQCPYEVIQQKGHATVKQTVYVNHFRLTNHFAEGIIKSVLKPRQILHK